MKVRLTSIVERIECDEAAELAYREAIDAQVRIEMAGRREPGGFSATYLESRAGVTKPPTIYKLWGHLNSVGAGELYSDVPLDFLPPGAQIGDEFTLYFERAR